MWMLDKKVVLDDYCITKQAHFFHFSLVVSLDNIVLYNDYMIIVLKNRICPEKCADIY
jgi:hypothetical protein